VSKKVPTQYLIEAIKAAGEKPPNTASRSEKKNYAERLSNSVAIAIARRLREFGLPDCYPNDRGGRERQFAGGIGAKKVDISYATEEDGLVLGVSVKSISFPDSKTKNFQKNLTNRRGDLLAEATTLHQRFPYAVIGGLFLFDAGAEKDGTPRRPSTFTTAHEYFKTFDRRSTQTNAVEKFEALGIVLYQASDPIEMRYYDAGDPNTLQMLDDFLTRLLARVAERNPDRFRFVGGKLAVRGLPPVPDHEAESDDAEE
jgi:hypothetical protein